MRPLTALAKTVWLPFNLLLRLLTLPARWAKPAKADQPTWAPPKDDPRHLWQAIEERRASGEPRLHLWQEIEARRAEKARDVDTSGFEPATASAASVGEHGGRSGRRLSRLAEVRGRVLVPVAALAALGVFGGVAVAYFTATGSGTATAKVGSPSVTLSDGGNTYGVVGDTVSVSGSGFSVSRAVSVTFNGSPVATSPGSPTTSGSGSISGVTFAVPPVAASATPYNVVVTGGSWSATATFTVKAPGAPTVSSTNPASPNFSTSPSVVGTAVANSTVKIYTNSTCTSTVAGSGVATGGNFSVSVAVSANQTTTFWATDTDAGGNASACSTTSVSYLNDNVAPAPTITAPTGDINTNTPTFTGAAGNQTADSTHSADGTTITIDICNGTQTSCSSGSGSFDTALTTTRSGTTWSVTPSGSLGADGTYTAEAYQSDAAGNTGNSGPVGFTVDTTPPTQALSLTAATGAYLSGNTLYWNGNDTTTGTFEIVDGVTDAGSGPASATFPAIGTTGWTHNLQTVTSGSPGGANTTDYTSSAYSWGGTAVNPSNQTITGKDAAGNQVTTNLTFVDDTTAPTSSITCNTATCSSGWYTASPVAISISATDNSGGSGIKEIVYTTDGTTPSLTNGTVVSAATASFNITTNGTTSVQWIVEDNVGNVSSVGSQSVKLDTTTPTVSTVIGQETGAVVNGYVQKSTAYYVYANATDSVSGVASVTANVNNVTTGDTAIALTSSGGPFTAPGGGSYTYRSAALTSNNQADGQVNYTVNATDTAGTSSSYSNNGSVTFDTTPPQNGAFTANSVSATAAGATTYLSTSGSTSVGWAGRSDYTDSGSGLKSSTLTVETGSLSGNACTGYGSPTTLNGSSGNQTGLTADHCYLFTLTGIDNVGNVAAISVTVIVTGNATKLVFTQQPVGGSGLTEGQNFNTSPTASFEDSASNIVGTDTNSVTLSIDVYTAGGGGSTKGTLGCTSNAVAAVAGSASFTDCQITGTAAAGGYTLEGAGGSFNTGASNSVTINAGAQSAFELSAASTTPTAGATDVLTITAVDANGNTITTDSSNDNLTFGGADPIGSHNPTVTNTSGTAEPFGTATTIAFTNGVATEPGSSGHNGVMTLYDAEGPIDITVTDGTYSNSAYPNSVTVSPAAANSLTFHTQPSGTVGEAQAFTQPVVYVLDTYGNLATGDSGTVTLATDGYTAGSSGGSTEGSIASCTNPVSVSSGIATFSGCEITGTAAAGTYTLDATHSGTGVTGTGASTGTVTVTAGAASQLLFTTQPGGTVGEGVAFTQPVVKVEDTNGNVVTSSAAGITLATDGYTAGGGGSTKGGISGCTNPLTPTSGVATFTGCEITGTAAAGTYTLDATNGSLTTPASTGTVTITAGTTLSKFLLSLTSPQTSATAFTGTNTLTAEDSNGNTITGFSASTNNVTLSAGTGLTGTVSFACTSPSSCATGAILNKSGDFVNGVANLSSSNLGLTFTGSGVGTFTATSGSATGTSGTVGIQSTVNFSSSGTLTVPASTTATTVTFTIIGGGGAGGNDSNGGSANGGGSGGTLSGTLTVPASMSATTISVVIGQGGTTSDTGGTGCMNGGSGGNSQYDDGGGGGGATCFYVTSSSPIAVAGGGGGGGGYYEGTGGNGSGGASANPGSSTASNGVAGQRTQGSNSVGTGGGGGEVTTSSSFPFTLAFDTATGTGAAGTGNKSGTAGGTGATSNAGGTGGGTTSDSGNGGGGGGGGYASGGGGGGGGEYAGAGGGGGGAGYSGGASGIQISNISFPTSTHGAGGGGGTAGSAGYATFTGPGISG